MVDIQEYVARSLEQIVKGVMDAQRAVAGTTAGVNPFPEGIGAKDQLTKTHPQDVEFDIAVSVRSGTGSEAKLSVAMWGIGGGAGGQSSENRENVSRIRFKVPVVFPLHGHEERKKPS